MKKILHMSDLHIGYRNSKDKFLKIIDELPIDKKEASKYVVIITGDLVNNANKFGSYEEAKEGLAYLKKRGFHDVLIVPGNHDYGSGTKGHKKFVRKVQEAFYGKEIVFPTVDIISRMAFIGLDSMAQELNWYDALFSEGELGKRQLERLGEIFLKDRIRACTKRVVYLHHHPFQWRPLHQLKDSRKLKRVLKKAMESGVSIDALLFGHNHQGGSYNGRWDIPRCYDAGTTTLKARSKSISWAPWFNIRSSTRVIDLSRNPSHDYILS
ncbi:MAG: metallophosphoesterase [Candidatus Aceula meridiana]|nr:metallophosphoesterase [Candidatus Aceula meridiana]